MTITLPPDVEVMVRAEVAEGGYASGSAVVQDALRQRYEGRTRDELDHDLDEGLADIESGRFLPLDAAFGRVRRSLAGE